MTCSRRPRSLTSRWESTDLAVGKSRAACAVGITVTAFMAANTTETVETYRSERGSYYLCSVEPTGPVCEEAICAAHGCSALSPMVHRCASLHSS
jgi:hypothetical protein